MAIIGQIIGKVCSGASTAFGMNLSKGKLQILARPKKIFILAPGTILDPSRNFGDAYMNELMEEGKLDIIDDIESFNQVGNEDSIETKESGLETLLVDGLYKFQMKFNKGLFGNKQMATLRGFGNYSFGFMDGQGNSLFTKAANGGMKGFKAGLVLNDKYQFQTTQAGEQSGLMFQLTDRNEIDLDYAFVPECEFEGTARLIEGVSQVGIDFVNDPANADTTITYDVVLEQDQVTPLEGLESGDVRLRVNGTSQSITPTPVAGTPGRYTSTVTALSTDDEVKIDIYNTGDNRGIINKDGDKYKSEVLTETVV